MTAPDIDALCTARWQTDHGWTAPHWMRDKSGWTYPGHIHEESRQRDRKQMRAFLASSAWERTMAAAPLKLRGDNDRLRGAIEAIRQATLRGDVCDDVAWFSQIETLHDFCAGTLEKQP